MAEYLVLIYEDESSWASGGQEAWDRAMKDHTDFGNNNGLVLGPEIDLWTTCDE